MAKDKPDTESETKNADKPVDLLTHPAYEEVLQKLDEAEQKANQYWDRILRMQADAENIARRNEREVASAHKYAIDKFVADLIPIIDSLELCLSNVPEKLPEAANAVIEGVRMTLNMFYKVMEKFGIKQVNPVDEAFDPEFQQAISTQVSTTLKPGTVVSVLQKGYTLNNRLVRPALVVVSKAE